MSILIATWNGIDATARAEFAAYLCKHYPSLICAIIKEQAKCPASTMREWLFDDSTPQNSDKEK